MPRTLTVSEIRQHLYQTAGCPGGPGQPSLPLLGRLFHETFVALTGPDPAQNLVRPLEQADATLASWIGRLVDHAYLWQVGPQLGRHQAELQQATNAVLAYWEAVRQLCQWVAEVLWEQRRRQPGVSLEALRQRIFVGHEEELEAEITDPAWQDTVVVRGRADHSCGSLPPARFAWSSSSWAARPQRSISASAASTTCCCRAIPAGATPARHPSPWWRLSRSAGK